MIKYFNGIEQTEAALWCAVFAIQYKPTDNTEIRALYYCNNLWEKTFLTIIIKYKKKKRW